MKKIFSILSVLLPFSIFAQLQPLPINIYAVLDSVPRLDTAGNLKGATVNKWAMPAVSNPNSLQHTLTTAILNKLMLTGGLTDSFVVYKPNSKEYAWANLSFLNNYQPYAAPQYVRLGTNFSTTSTTLQNVNGMTLALLAGKKYKLQFIGYAQTSLISNGYNYNIQYSGTLAESMGFNDSHATTARNAFSFNSTTSTPSIATANTPYGITTDVIFKTNTAGNIQLQFSSTSGLSTAQLNAGAIILIHSLD